MFVNFSCRTTSKLSPEFNLGPASGVFVNFSCRTTSSSWPESAYPSPRGNCSRVGPGFRVWSARVGPHVGPWWTSLNYRAGRKLCIAPGGADSANGPARHNLVPSYVKVEPGIRPLARPIGCSSTFRAGLRRTSARNSTSGQHRVCSSTFRAELRHFRARNRCSGLLVLDTSGFGAEQRHFHTRNSPLRRAVRRYVNFSRRTTSSSWPESAYPSPSGICSRVGLGFRVWSARVGPHVGPWWTSSQLWGRAEACVQCPAEPTRRPRGRACA